MDSETERLTSYILASFFALTISFLVYHSIKKKGGLEEAWMRAHERNKF